LICAAKADCATSCRSLRLQGPTTVCLGFSGCRGPCEVLRFLRRLLQSTQCLACPCCCPRHCVATVFSEVSISRWRACYVAAALAQRALAHIDGGSGESWMAPSGGLGAASQRFLIRMAHWQTPRRRLSAQALGFEGVEERSFSLVDSAILEGYREDGFPGRMEAGRKDMSPGHPSIKHITFSIA
jgi:hypothetical protein